MSLAQASMGVCVWVLARLSGELSSKQNPLNEKGLLCSLCHGLTQYRDPCVYPPHARRAEGAHRVLCGSAVTPGVPGQQEKENYRLPRATCTLTMSTPADTA